MKLGKFAFERELVNLITPYVVQPEQGTAEFIIIVILNKIKDEMSYSCHTCLNEMDESHGRTYGASKIDENDIDEIVYNLQCMRQFKQENHYESN